MALLENDVAVVTGGSSGIGRNICETFASEGASIVVADIREEPRSGGTPTHELVAAEYGVDATFVECDVSEKADLESAAEAAEDLGGLDVWVNNAGIFRGEEFTEVTEDELDQMLDINVKGTYFGAQVAIEAMVENGGGSLINLSSVAGLEGSGDFVSYCTSKGGVRLMTYSLADKYGPEGVRVNAIHPGVIETEMVTDDVPIIGGEGEEAFRQQVPLRRFGVPQDIGSAALFLASDMSSYVNGESLVVDGGQTNT
ncbi:FabG protein [Halorhabdus tiamatea SARL4B]|uniref:3-oxoacyl-[acyl-carrier protein] reductase n=1 Tax=Halorhabdus tiamatea SARL4B TaxID=1033806 RepID=F7PI68_9EURY|nr:SDR family oxidoreductase [Halorhabdus tiamatea]ERJ05241.1 FabG protein [Halorhabdus tiamatea SARL4B]CCQ32187.1 3-oxoacyl-[acyl-carrier protein] reductase [Halorhabdus tiamatea SARL4B]